MLFLYLSSLDVLFSLTLIKQDYISLLSVGNLMTYFEGQIKKRTGDLVTEALGGVFSLDKA